MTAADELMKDAVEPAKKTAPDAGTISIAGGSFKSSCMLAELQKPALSVPTYEIV